MNGLLRLSESEGNGRGTSIMSQNSPLLPLRGPTLIAVDSIGSSKAPKPVDRQMPDPKQGRFFVSPHYQPMLRQIGLDGPAVFEDPRIKPWRTLPDRQNCTLDFELPGGSPARWHIKRFNPATGATAAIDNEVKGHEALSRANIPTAALVGYGTNQDGGSFVIFEDLAGYKPADKLIEAGMAFDPLLEPTAALAARLHSAGLHHRDLYLCHFMARVDANGVDVRLIDTARVKPLPGRFTRMRWIVKDLAQFWYSTLRHPITDEQRSRWLGEYAKLAGTSNVDSMRRKIERKSRSIARHDARLHRHRPERDVSLPG